MNIKHLRRDNFLSCLRGSERHIDRAARSLVFLSCLRGSEQVAIKPDFSLVFLSCLRGSELALYPLNALFPRENRLNHGELPFFMVPI